MVRIRLPPAESLRTIGSSNFLVGSERLKDNRRMRDAAHNQHSETRRPSNRDRLTHRN